MNAPGSSLRVLLLALLAIGFWFIGAYVDGMPAPKGVDAPAADFSEGRARATLHRLLDPETPHPVSSPANAVVRARIVKEFAALGVKTSIYTGTGCEGRTRYGFFACGTANDILAEVAPGQGKAIVLLAHYDSVPAGPGASDDQSGVATILETVRALKAGGLKSDHPILAVITDGEEAGLLGASAFVTNPALRDRVGVVVNVEARGNAGPSLLFQTSPGDGPLIDLYDRAVSEHATSSLFAVIYKLLPNDTDLTVFLDKGFTGFNFAFSGNVAHYHTPLDTIAHLDPSTLQMHGDNLFGIVHALAHTDFATLQGSDDIYLTLLGRFVPRMPAGWALPLALVVFAMIVAAAFLSQGEVLGIGRRVLAFAMPLIALVGAGLFGWLLHAIASLISGQPDPSYAHPIALRLALGAGVFAATVFVSRFASPRMAALAIWGWMALLAVVTAALLPGLSPYFLFPCLIGAPLLLIQSRMRGAWTGTAGQAALLASALLPLLIWMALAASGEMLQGLVLHPLFTIPVALGALTLVPLTRPLSRPTWLRLCGGGAAVAVALAMGAGFQPAYSTIKPQRLNITFIDDHLTGKSLWSADTSAPLPKQLRDAAPFGNAPEIASPIGLQPSYLAPAGKNRFAVPTADASSEMFGAGRIVTLQLRGSEAANGIIVVVPKDAGLARAEIDGHSFTPDTASGRDTVVACVTRDCRSKLIRLTFAGRGPVDLTIGEQRYSLPPDGAKLLAARPVTATKHQSGDTTLIFGKLRVP
ncbi:MAG: M20/M25/M40 family metallo-hydrolase [Proteobacteria bacterium]|nr:M20/M25/M40 family metallo-hydrolase [Pseudomonadota bacterium]